MTQPTDAFQSFAEFQRQALEPFRAYQAVAAQTFERIARQNYAVLGDYVEFAVEQARLATRTTDVNDYLGQQVTHARAFGEKLAQRTHEYTEIARAAQEATTAAVAEKPAQKKAA